MRTCSFCSKEIEEGEEFQEKLNGLKNDSKKFCNDETRRCSKTSYG
ncbi:hypothetical protein [uncultured Methanobrevibacter sp.]|nr:hypothetical protein [uncultured Methanobrevibacter sp.]